MKVGAVTPILVKRKDTAFVLQMSQRKLDRLRAAGKIGPREIKLGGGVFFSRAELERWVASAKNGSLPDRAEWMALNERKNSDQTRKPARR